MMASSSMDTQTRVALNIFAPVLGRDGDLAGRLPAPDRRKRAPGIA
jgi:hypothetical protein